MADAIASLPAVKFRFTGTLPAISVADVASAPPTVWRQQQADHFSDAAQCRRIHVASSRLPASARRRSVRGRWNPPWRSGPVLPCRADEAPVQQVAPRLAMRDGVAAASS